MLLESLKCQRWNWTFNPLMPSILNYKLFESFEWNVVQSVYLGLPKISMALVFLIEFNPKTVFVGALCRQTVINPTTKWRFQMIFSITLTHTHNTKYCFLLLAFAHRIRFHTRSWSSFFSSTFISRFVVRMVRCNRGGGRCCCCWLGMLHKHQLTQSPTAFTMHHHNSDPFERCKTVIYMKFCKDVGFWCETWYIRCVCVCVLCPVLHQIPIWIRRHDVYSSPYELQTHTHRKYHVWNWRLMLVLLVLSHPYTCNLYNKLLTPWS